MNMWKRPFNNIATGFLLSLIQINFWYMQYILPAIGVVLIYLGFKEMQDVNKDLKVAYKLSKGYLVVQLISLVYVTSSLRLLISNLLFGMAIAIYEIVLLLYFSKGIKKELENKGDYKGYNPILGIVTLKIVAYPLIFLGFSQGFIALIYLIVYIYILVKLYKYSRCLYGIQLNKSENFKYNNNTILLNIYSFLALAFVVVSISSTLSYHSFKKGEVYSAVLLTKERADIVKLGFPYKLLQDFDDEEVALFKNIEKLETYEGILHFNKPLDAEIVFITLENGDLYGVQGFKLNEERASFTDFIQITNTEIIRMVSAHLLYDEDEVTYKMDMPIVDEAIISEINGRVSYPFETKNQRGYIIFQIFPQSENRTGANILNYYHYSHPYRIPFEEKAPNVMFHNNRNQFLSNYEYRLDKSQYLNNNSDQ